MAKLKILIIILHCLLVNVSAYGEFGPQPRIISSSGHLIFNSAENKDIHFVTKGSGKIKLNDGDLTDAASLARNATATLNKINSEYYDTVVQVQQLKRSLEGGRGILMRLANLETGHHSSNGSTDQQNGYVSSVLNRRMRTLERKVNRLMTMLRTDECNSNPCQNGGTCQDLFNGYLCYCPTEWEGPNCDRDVNECSRFAGTDLGCQNGATCVNKPGTYECVCNSGWFGIHCTQQTASCTNGSATELCGHGICLPQGHGYTCLCDQGWTKEGTNPVCLKDVDECALTTRPACSLDPPVSCINVPGSFYCGNCPAGYSGVGQCTDINECEMFNGGCSVNPMVHCINTRGSRVCGSCPSGYVGDGTTCSFQGVCGLNNGGCSVLAQCRDNPRISSTYVECICPPGYFGTGIGPSGCTRSQNQNPCDNNPCIHGTCAASLLTGSYICSCNQQYTGTICNIRKDSCRLSPCLNGGSCIDIAGLSYTCICASGYTGNNCAEQRQACGGHLRELTGVLKYPSTSSIITGDSINCVWIIQTNNTKVLNITFTEFHLEDSQNCRSGWLEIHDGRNSAANSIGRFCGSNFPHGGTLTSTHNAFYVWIKAQSASHAGFSLNWTTIDPVCGGSISFLSQGILTSPGFPRKYPVNRDCYWHLTAPAGKRIQLHFFSLEIGNGSINCTSDFVKVYEGESTNQLLAQYCNTSLPEQLMSSGPNVVVYFHSDSSDTFSGFQIGYSAVEGIPGCGGIYTGTSGTLSSPLLNGEYLPNLNCEYKISALEKSRIRITFETFDIEGSTGSCYYDYVEVTLNAGDLSRNLSQNLNNPGCTPRVRGYPINFTQSRCKMLFSRKLMVNSAWKCLYTVKSVLLSIDYRKKVNCGIGYVTIFEGSSTEAPAVGRYCGINMPGPYTSTGNHLLIVFNTDYGDSGAGFRIKYDIICGGVYMEPSGVITSPGYPDLYKEDQICIYEIMQPLGRSITLEFYDFDIESIESSYYEECMFDFVEIHDGESENSTLIGRYCEQRPPLIQSTYNMLWIKFESDSSIGEKGFTANYTTTDMGCGGILRNTSGTIESPREDEFYPQDSNCTWIIVAPPGYIVELSWSSFELESGSSCSYDYVEIFGNYSNNEKFAKYCGDTLPPTITSTSNIMTVKFITDVSVNYGGFVANYVIVNERTVCGGRYQGNSGIIKSPGFPSEYLSDRECTWVIGTGNGQQIMLHVKNFTLENSTDCRYDYLEIRNGGSQSSPLIGKYCGDQIPREIPSHTNYLYLFFRSDISRSESGFKIDWDSAATGCGGILTSPTGNILSPNYPNPYSENTKCQWRISVNAGSRIRLNVTDLDLEKNWVCSIDYLEIFDGPNEQSPSLGTFCNHDEQTPNVTSTSNHMTVKFISDASIQKRGFSLEYSAVCKNDITGFRGVIESPNYPNQPEEQECDWKIKVPVGNKINLTFTSFDITNYDIPTTERCLPDYLKIKYIGSEFDLLTLGTYCNSDRLSLLTVDSNIAEIFFKSREDQPGGGFRLEWQIEGCGGLLTRPNGVIKTPNYPNGYPENTQCDWIIHSDYGLSIEFTFTDVDLEKSYDCNFDFIMITNGPNESYPLLSKICSKGTKPVVVTSSGNEVFVRFKSDFSYKGKGFIANYTSLPTKCGGKLTGVSGSFTSPNYPKDYDTNDRCEWLIEVEQGHVIDLEIDECDLSGSCRENYVAIYDGPSPDSLQLRNICLSSEKNITVRSSSNSILVVMSTSNPYSAKGFSATYYTACGGFITTNDSGIIRSTDSVFSARDMSNCSWYIVASDPTQHIWLTISHIHMVDYGGKIDIYNGDSKDAPLALTLTEDKLPPPFASAGNALHIQLVGFSMDFIATYSVLDSVCGGVLSKSDGYFATPNYPNPYPIEIQCEWTIQVAPGNQISLSFNNFELVSSQNCHVDYLEIRENNGTGKLLGTFCDAMPTNITQLGSLWLLFQSSKIPGDDSGATANGFLAEYSLNHAVELSGPTGQIASPLYPDVYLKSDVFSWRVTVKFGKVISITFKDFSVEMDYQSECYFTYLEIYDGFDEEAPKLGALCGVSLPKSIKTSSNVVYIRMSFEMVRQGSKFLLEWTQMDFAAEGPVIPKPKGCGSNGTVEVFNSTSFNLTSPGYPNGYAENLQCEWIFSTSPNYHFVFTFVNIDLENLIEECIMDYVQIYSGIGGSENWDLIKTVCSPNYTRRMEKISTTNLMKVVFTTDSYSNGTGFNALVTRVCGGSIQGLSNGVIRINSSEIPYRSTCQWNVTVRPGRTINVIMEELNMLNEVKDSSCLNYVLLKNGLEPHSPILGNGKYCNNTIPPPLVTTGNYLSVLFAGHKLTNFSLTFEELSQDCGETITLSTFHNITHISSPNYPNIPPPFSECVWTIVAPPGESLRLDFEDRFDVTRSKNCKLAGVEIRDGGSKYSPILQTYCTVLPNSTFSSDNMMTVRFYTNVADPKNGFKASIAIASCGGTIRSNYAEVHSPNFNMKSKFPKNANCGWNIIGPPNHYLIINFNTLDLGDSVCYENYVTIQEKFKINQTMNNIGKYCGDELLSEIRTASNEAFIHFVTGNYWGGAKGFSLSFNASRDECGGTLNMETGFIQSPGYPEAITSDRKCEWFITVPEGRRITLEMLDLDLAETPGNGMYIAQDQNFNSIMEFLPDSNHTTVFKSSTNTMKIYYYIRFSSRRGFRARFTSDEPTICIGNFNQSSGVINNLNTTSYYCSWKHYRNINENQTLSLAISVNSKPKFCRYPPENLIITADDTKDALAQFCEFLPHPVIIRSPYVLTQILVYSESLDNIFPFSINYTTNPCGGIIPNEEGDITTPGFPNKYPGSIECAWLLKLPSDQKIRVNFTTVNLDENCDNNYILIYNGEFRTKPKLGQFCQNNKPSLIISQSNMLLIEYHADQQSNGTGFKFHYEPVEGGCSGIFHDASRIIETPLYPNNYPNNSECNWEVMVEDGYHVVFEFVDRFYIEESENCKNDFVELWDYVDDQFKSAGKFCGRNLPQNFNSTSNRMKILFRSNENIRATGFKAKWTIECGGTFEATAKQQYIASPGYPTAYKNKLVCSYNITSPGNYINLVFEDFKLEDVCAYDYLTITRSDNYPDMYYYDQIETSRRLTGPYCGTDKPAPLHIHDGVIIRFVTDAWVVKRGFKFSYSIESCGGLITVPSQIASPTREINGVQGYSNTLKCFWNITAPENKNVVVRFTQLNLEFNSECHHDFIDVYDGTSFNDSTRLGKLCGNLTSNPPIIQSKSNSMLIYMATDNSISLEGFKAEVYFTYGPAVGCGGTIIVNDTATIEAPVGLSHLECHWIITTENDNILKFHFNELHLVPCSANRSTTFGKQTCDCDILEVRDGGASVSELITRLCDNNIPPDVSTSSHTAWLRLSTMQLSTVKAFKVTIQKVPSICGPSSLVVTNETKVLTSPLYPNPYPDNIRCNWILKSESYANLLDLHFTDFDLVNVTDQEFLSEMCTSDKVEISDQNNKIISEGLGTASVFAGSARPEIYTMSQAPVGIHPYCGRHATSFDYYSGRNEAVVSFFSGNGRSHGKGFRMEYRIAGCNRNYTSLQGRIRNANFAGNCDISINVARNTTISLYFMNFMMYDSSDCSNNGMQIYDGDSKRDPLMATFCGYETPNPIYSKSEKLFIHIYNNAKSVTDYYDIIYTSTNEGKGCGGIFYNYLGKFTSPLYPAPYRERKTCTWEIIVPQGMQIMLKFSVFDVGGVCDQNYVDVKTFQQDNSDSTVHHFCSSDNPAVLKSENNHMSLSYTTTANNGGSGWVAHFAAVNADTNVKWDY